MFVISPSKHIFNDVFKILFHNWIIAIPCLLPLNLKRTFDDCRGTKLYFIIIDLL